MSRLQRWQVGEVVAVRIGLVVILLVVGLAMLILAGLIALSGK
jgi:hypothetical protein